MSGKAVAKRMGTNLFADSGVTDGIAKDHEDVVAADWLAGIVSGKEPFFRSAVLPVLAQGFKQDRGQHHHAIFLPFTLMHGDGHARRIDVADSQTGYFGAPQAGRVNGHEQGAAFEMLRRSEYLCYLLATKDQRKLLCCAREWNVLWQKRVL